MQDSRPAICNLYYYYYYYQLIIFIEDRKQADPEPVSSSSYASKTQSPLSSARETPPKPSPYKFPYGGNNTILSTESWVDFGARGPESTGVTDHSVSMSAPQTPVVATTTTPTGALPTTQGPSNPVAQPRRGEIKLRIVKFWLNVPALVRPCSFHSLIGIDFKSCHISTFFRWYEASSRSPARVTRLVFAMTDAYPPREPEILGIEEDELFQNLKDDIVRAYRETKRIRPNLKIFEVRVHEPGIFRMVRSIRDENLDEYL